MVVIYGYTIYIHNVYVNLNICEEREENWCGYVSEKGGVETRS